MKKSLKFVTGILFFSIIMANLYIFMQGLSLSDQIEQYEKDIAKLKEVNIDLEGKVYQSQSYTHAASVAATLNYTKKAVPVYIDNLLYAHN